MKSEPEVILTAENITKTFHVCGGDVTILNGANLSVRCGELVSIRGKSGSGKSTLLNILSGFMKADSGRIVIGGTDVSSAGARELTELRNRKIGFVFQDCLLIEELSVFENIILPAEIFGGDRKKYVARAEELAHILGIGDRLGQRVSRTSGGERSRTAIARALVMEPLLCFLDEPTGALDNRTASAVEDLVISVSRKCETAFVYVTHDLNFAERATRRLEIRDGELFET